tara:strand:+ start:4279 stop:4557 length:279 start_codon:yes stop_codon:yes gene_type:complete
MTETLIILSVGLIVAAVMLLREKPLPPREDRFRSVEEFLAFLADQGGSTCDEHLTPSEEDIAWSAVKLRSATHRSDGFTGVGWFILEGQPSA